MIRDLRRRHRILAPGMLVASLTSVVVAIVTRPPRTTQPTLAVESSRPSTSVDDLGVDLRIAPAVGGGHLIWVRTTKPLGIPDPLLYLVSVAPSDSNRLAPDAVLVGSVGPEFRGATKVESPASAGYLVIWSNGYRRIAGVAPFDFGAASQR